MIPLSDNRENKNREKNTRKRGFILLLIFLGILLLLTPPAFTTRSNFYRGYEQIKKRYEFWKASSHSPLSCIECHVEPGIGQYTLFALKSIPIFYARLIGASEKPDGLFKKPTKRACRKCHVTYRKVSAYGDLMIPHRAHVEVLKLECTDCHQKLVHWPNPLGLNRPRMVRCLKRCHNGKRATNKCRKCHTEKAYPVSHRAKNWLQIHSQKQKEIKCSACHGWTPDLCKACHSKKPRTHIGNWKKLHQQRAKLRGKGCLVCHGGRKFCLRCHDEGLSLLR